MWANKALERNRALHYEGVARGDRCPLNAEQSERPASHEAFAHAISLFYRQAIVQSKM
jgi:hypothetical protein